MHAQVFAFHCVVRKMPEDGRFHRVIVPIEKPRRGMERENVSIVMRCRYRTKSIPVSLIRPRWYRTSAWAAGTRNAPCSH